MLFTRMPGRESHYLKAKVLNLSELMYIGRREKVLIVYQCEDVIE